MVPVIELLLLLLLRWVAIVCWGSIGLIGRLVLLLLVSVRHVVVLMIRGDVVGVGRRRMRVAVHVRLVLPERRLLLVLSETIFR